MNAPAKQLSAEWFQQRIGMVTGSRIGAILGVSPFGKPETVLRDMVREYHSAESEFTGNRFTEWGNDHEQDAINALEISEGIMVEEAYFTPHPTFSFLGTSPDGLGSDGSVVECKCPQSIKSLDEVPHYLAQMQLHMECTGRKHCWFVQWTTSATQIDRIEYNPEWLKLHLETLQAFHELYMQTIQSDELSAIHLEDLVADMSGDDSWMNNAAELSYLSRQIKTLQDREKELKDWFKENYKGRKAAGGGISLYPTKRSATDYKSMIKDFEIDADLYKSESESWTVRVNTSS